MMRKIAGKSEFSRNLLLSVTASIAITMTVALGLISSAAANAQNQIEKAAENISKFEVASVKLVPKRQAGFFSMSPPGDHQFTMRNATLALLIAWTYDISSGRVTGKAHWLNSQRYDVIAEPPGNAGLSYKQLKPLMQQLLRNRFGLVFHYETKDVKGYDLVVAAGGPKLQATKGGATYAYLMSNRIDAQNITPSVFASMLSHPLQQPVADKTGLKGKYDIDIKFAPFDVFDSPLPSIFTTVQEQLGLKLERHKVPVKTIVIDHVDRVPTPN